MSDINARFLCETIEATVPVFCLTPGRTGAIHRFYDSWPVSPSGRYIALTRLPSEDRLPAPGEQAEVLVVDLVTGSEEVVARTAGFDTQLGAQVQWGASDREVVFNDLDTRTWRPFGVVLDPRTRARRHLDGAVYHVSSNGRYTVSPSLDRIGFTQLGYGVTLPQQTLRWNVGAPEDDGLFLTDLKSGNSRLLLSLAEISERLGPELGFPRDGDATLWGFHAKWNPQGTRVMFVVRHRGPRDGAGWLPALVTCRADGLNPRVAVSADVWARGGHHPTWMPDGETILMNLRAGHDSLRFYAISHDGANMRPLHETIPGSGHPTLHPATDRVLTDSYPHEPLARPDGTCPLRWIDPVRGAEQSLLWMPLVPRTQGAFRALRVDMHPAWDRTHTRVVVNGCDRGRRRVYLADLSNVVNEGLE